jgi:hypothetical protein
MLKCGEFCGFRDMHNSLWEQEVARSNRVAPILQKLSPNHDLRYLTTFVSAAKTRFQSWKNFHEMNGRPARGTKTQCFSVVSPAQAIRAG